MATAPTMTMDTKETTTLTDVIFEKKAKEEMIRKMVPGLDVLMYMTEQMAKQLGDAGHSDPEVMKLLASWKSFRPEMTSDQPQIPLEFKQYLETSIGKWELPKAKTKKDEKAEKAAKASPKLTFEYHFSPQSQLSLDDIKEIIDSMREKGMEGHVVFRS